MRLVFGFCLLAVACVPGLAFAQTGQVTHKVRGCSYLIIETTMGYVLAEQYSGIDVDIGDQLYGNFNSYGMTTSLNRSWNREIRFYIDDYMLGKSRALEKLYSKCD